MMLAGWLPVGLGYACGQLAPGDTQVLRETALDALVPFNASSVWLYLSFFLFVPAAWLFAAPARLRPLMRAMWLCAIGAALMFVVWPTTLRYPQVPAQSLSDAVWNLTAAIDAPKNCLPSLHGALTLLCLVAMWQRDRPWRTACFVLWGLAIIASVVMARRHLSIDLAAGVLLGACSAAIVRERRSMQSALCRAGTRTSANSSKENRL